MHGMVVSVKISTFTVGGHGSAYLLSLVLASLTPMFASQHSCQETIFPAYCLLTYTAAVLALSPCISLGPLLQYR